VISDLVFGVWSLGFGFFGFLILLSSSQKIRDYGTER
jgi:hypothetical protein